MTSLQGYVDKRVLIVTADGRTILGELKGFDQTTNVILADSVERIWNSEDGPEDSPLGLYVVRGDNIAIVGQIDEELNNSTDWSSLRAEPLSEIKH